MKICRYLSLLCAAAVCATISSAQTIIGTSLAISGPSIMQEVNASGTDTVTVASGASFIAQGAAANSCYSIFNNGGGTAYLGLDNSAGTGLFNSPSLPFALDIVSPYMRAVIIGPGGNPGAFFYPDGDATIIGTVTIDGDANVVGQSKAPHFSGSGPAPGVAAGDAAGTGGAVSINGNDSSGEIFLMEGAAPSSIGVLSVVFAVPYAVAPKSVTLTPANPATAQLYGPDTVYVCNEVGLEVITANGFVLCVAGGSLTPGAQYKWHYRVN